MGRLNMIKIFDEWIALATKTPEEIQKYFTPKKDEPDSEYTLELKMTDAKGETINHCYAIFSEEELIQLVGLYATLEIIFEALVSKAMETSENES